jgi:hypothetical protein
MSGCNYFVSIRDVLNAEKTLRFHSLTKVANVRITELVDIFSEPNEEKLITTSLEAFELINDLDCEEISLQCLEESVNTVLFYLAGFFSRSLMQVTNCDCCKKLLFESTDTPVFDMDFPLDDPEAMISKEKLLSLVNRGGLVSPTDLIFITTVYIYNFVMAIMEIPELQLKLLNFSHQSLLFVNALNLQIQKDESGRHIFELKCEAGHSFSSFIDKIAIKLFRICFQNLAKTKNDEIRLQKKRKKTDLSRKKDVKTRKAIKLTSKK